MLGLTGETKITYFNSHQVPRLFPYCSRCPCSTSRPRRHSTGWGCAVSEREARPPRNSDTWQWCCATGSCVGRSPGSITSHEHASAELRSRAPCRSLLIPRPNNQRGVREWLKIRLKSLLEAAQFWVEIKSEKDGPKSFSDSGFNSPAALTQGRSPI